MISLVGGELYQWDTGRIVRVIPDDNVKVHEVHFSTKRMDYAYVLKTYIVDGVTYCAIPNIILQQSNRLLCYEVCENSDGEETIANTYFDIIKRNRPEDYVYTEQDHFTIQALSNRVDKLEESSHTHSNKTELDTITEEDLETWRSPNSSAITGGAQVGTLFEDLEVTTTLAEDASEWTSASSQPFKCTFRPSPGQMVVVKVKDLDVDTITTAKIPPTGYPLGQTIIGNYSVVDSRLQSWYNNADSVPPTPNDLQANSCLVFEDQYYDSEHLAPSLPTCILYTKTPGTYKVTVTTLKHSIGPESVMKMYDVRPSTFVEYGTYANWKDLTKSGKYGLWEVNIKKTNYYNGVYLKEINGTKYVYVYHSEQKVNPDGGFTTIEHTLTYDTATETVACSDTTINPETDVVISVHLDQVISAVPDSATSLGKPSADKVGKMLTTVDLGEGVIDNKWQSRRYEYQWVDAPKAGSVDVVKYTEQTLTDGQKTQARTNIGAISVDELPVASYLTKGVGYVGFESSGSDTNDFDYDLHEAIGIDNEKFCYTPAIRGNFDTKLSVDFLKKNLQYSGGHAKSYLFGSADEDIANSLSLSNKDFPITVTVMNFDYNSPPTWYYLMVTARGRTGKFALKATESVISSVEPYTSFINPERKELPPTDDYVVGNVDENGNLWSYRTLNSFAKHNVLSKDTVLYQMTGNKSIVYIFGSGDETVSSLNLTASNYPVVVTYTGYEIMYNNTPKFSYIITTADGKKGSFTWFIKDNNPSPITWTFEGGGGSGGNPLFIITPTYNEDTKTWSTDRTWDEVKAAVAKSNKPSDYSIDLGESLLSPNGLSVGRNGSGEIANVQMRWIIADPMVMDINETPDGFNSGLVPFISYFDIKYEASSSGINFTYAESGEIPQAIIKSVLITKSNNRTLVCSPSNAVELYGGLLFNPQNPDHAQFICPLYYNGETYHYETGEKDSSNIVSLYFSTVSNGIYKRLKITQGQNGAADTVVMDKEIELVNLNGTMFRGEVAGGTIYRGTDTLFANTENLDTYSIRAFQSLCKGTRNAYLTLYGKNTSKYELEPGGFADGIYSLNYNGKAALQYSIRSTYTDIGFVGDILNIIKNDSKITEYELLADQFGYSVIPRNDIMTDGTTIKFNEQGQLTLAQEIGATIVQAPKYVNSVAEMTDVNRPYVLISTGHIWAYMNTTTEQEVTKRDNIIGTTDNPYQTGRLSSSGSVSTDIQTHTLTPYIDLTKAEYQGKTIQIHLEGNRYASENNETYIMYGSYKSDKTAIVGRGFTSIVNGIYTDYDNNGQIISLEILGNTSAVLTIGVPLTSDTGPTTVGFLRFCGLGLVTDSVYITYPDIETVTGGQWCDTGVTYGGGQDAQLTAKVAALNNEGNLPSTIKLLPKPVLDFYNASAYSDSDYSYSHLEKITYPCRADIPVPYTVKWNYNESAMRTTVAVDTRAIGTVNAYTMRTYDATGLNKFPIYNLLPNKTYYYNVTHVLSDGSLVEAKSGSFTTSSEAWRLLYIDGTQNVRDLGGWTGLNGKKVKYGKIIRGAALNDSSLPELLLTGKGRRSLGELAIQAELNLGAIDTETSIAANCVYKKIGYTNYAIAFTDETYRAQFKEVLEWIVEQLTASKPIYMHCQGGCDRTGTLSFQLLGLLGVSESDLAKEYELSSFSNIGFGRLRTTTKVVDTYDYVGMVEVLKTYSGDTITEKFYNFAITGCGISNDTITSFRNLMLE